MNTAKQGVREKGIADVTKPKLYKHKIDIHGTIVDGYDTFDHVPVIKCLDYIYGLAGISAKKQLTRSRGINEGR